MGNLSGIQMKAHLDMVITLIKIAKRMNGAFGKMSGEECKNAIGKHSRLVRMLNPKSIQGPATNITCSPCMQCTGEEKGNFANSHMMDWESKRINQLSLFRNSRGQGRTMQG